MNIDLGIRLTDPNFDYDSITRYETLISSFETNPKKKSVNVLIKKVFAINYFFYGQEKQLILLIKKI